jgi:hypothetical protein
VPLAYQSGPLLSPFKIASDSDIALVLNGSVSLRRSTKVKGRSITLSMPTIFCTVRLFGYTVFLSSPFEDIFIVIHPKWIRLSIDDIASVVTVVTNNPRKYASLARIVVDFCIDSSSREERKDKCDCELHHVFVICPKRKNGQIRIICIVMFLPSRRKVRQARER